MPSQLNGVNLRDLEGTARASESSLRLTWRPAIKMPGIKGPRYPRPKNVTVRSRF